MRVAMVADCYHPVINGVVTSVSCLVQALESQGLQVHVSVTDESEYAASFCVVETTTH